MTEEHSNSQIVNKLTMPWLKKEKDKQANNSTQDTTQKTKD